MSGTPTIRPVRREDLPAMISFIQAAAEETDPSASPAATVERLTQTLHLNPDDNRFVFALVIESPTGEVAGHAIYFYSFSAWRAQPGITLDELFVKAEYRSKGYAQLLMEALAREAGKKGCGILEWHCYRDNERALRFYDKIGAKRMEQWVTLRVVDGGIAKLGGER